MNTDKTPFKVLLVEDDEDDFILTRGWLSEINGGQFHLDWVTSYDDALETIKRTQHDVYLIDYQLGQHNGLELMRNAVGNGCNAPMIMLTGQGDREVDIKAARAGAVDYLVKGQIDADSLERSIRYALERKQAEKALREREMRYRNLFTRTPISIWEVDLSEVGKWLDKLRADGITDLAAYLKQNPNTLRQATKLLKINDVNDSSLALFEAKDKQHLIDSLATIFDKEVDSIFAEELLAIWEGKSRPEFEFTTHTLEEKLIHCVLHWVIPGDADNLDLSNSIVAIIDITQRVHTEQALLQAQKTESLGVLAGGVAHDFNNLLVAILGQASLALNQMTPGSAAHDSIEKTVHAAERAADLVRQLLTYSGRGQVESRPVYLNSLIRENLQLFEVSVGKKVQLSSKLTTPLPLIGADAGQMQQVIMNLILNAAEAIGDKPGTVTVKTGMQDVAAGEDHLWQYTGHPLPPGRYLTLEVHDDGSGMDAETLSKIFDPFFTTKISGHGLGLAAVLGIIRGHKGGLQVHSQPNKGTTFKLLLPTLDIEPVALTSLEVAHDDVMPDDTILVIDDEEPVREAITDILEAEGWQVMAASKGTSGIELYRRQPDNIRLVLLDLSMPDMNGEETFRVLREINPNVRVILSSGYHESEATRLFQGKGLKGFIQKPYDANTLITKIHRYIQ